MHWSAPQRLNRAATIRYAISDNDSLICRAAPG
jgi:hypothetical protein